MPKYVVERTIPGVGTLPPEELAAVARKSIDAVNQLGAQIQWIHSYVAHDQTYCVYHAANAEIVAEHSRLAGFPVDTITAIKCVIDPATAEQQYAAASES